MPAIVFTRCEKEAGLDKKYRAMVTNYTRPRNYRKLRKPFKTAVKAILYGMDVVRRFNRLIEYKSNQEPSAAR